MDRNRGTKQVDREARKEVARRDGQREREKERVKLALNCLKLLNVDFATKF